MCSPLLFLDFALPDELVTQFISSRTNLVRDDWNERPTRSAFVNISYEGHVNDLTQLKIEYFLPKTSGVQQSDQ